MVARRAAPKDGVDAATGQVYTETTCSQPTGDDQDWQFRSIMQSRLERFGTWPPWRCSNKTAPRLRDIVVQLIVKHSSLLTPEHIGALPLHLTREIWRKIVDHQAISFHTFQLFAPILYTDAGAADEDLSHFKHTSAVMDSPRLAVVTQALRSDAFRFIAVLRITADVKLSELVALSDLVNLGVLEVDPKDRSQLSEGVFNDRLIRNWSLAAQDGAFPVLRVLLICGARGITKLSLQYLSAFPALGLFETVSCTLSTQTLEPLEIPGAWTRWETEYLARACPEALPDSHWAVEAAEREAKATSVTTSWPQPPPLLFSLDQGWSPRFSVKHAFSGLGRVGGNADLARVLSSPIVTPTYSPGYGESSFRHLVACPLPLVEVMSGLWPRPDRRARYTTNATRVAFVRLHPGKVGRLTAPEGEVKPSTVDGRHQRSETNDRAAKAKHASDHRAVRPAKRVKIETMLAL